MSEIILQKSLPTVSRFSENMLKDLVVWVLPIFAIPGLRYVQDTKNPNRKTLLIRDVFSYGLGATSFFTLKYLALKAMRNSSIVRKDLMGTLVGSAGYFVFASTGVLKLTDWVDKKFGNKPAAPVQKQPSPVQPMRPAMPSRPVLPVQARPVPSYSPRPAYYPQGPAPFQMNR